MRASKSKPPGFRQRTDFGSLRANVLDRCITDFVQQFPHGCSKRVEVAVTLYSPGRVMPPIHHIKTFDGGCDEDSIPGCLPKATECRSLGSLLLRSSGHQKGTEFNVDH